MVLGPRPMTLVELHFAKKETAFVFEECFEYLPYTLLQVLFSYIVILRIYAELIVIIGFDRAENRSALVWETVV